MRIIVTLSFLFLNLPFSFAQKFQNISHEIQYKAKVNSVTRYEYKIPIFHREEMNDSLTKSGYTKYFTEYTATGRLRRLTVSSSFRKTVSVFEYDKFDNALKRITTQPGTDAPPEILRYVYNYEKKSVVIFKDGKKYKFRQYDEKNRIINEETFYENSNRKTHNKIEIAYDTNGSKRVTYATNGKIRGVNHITFDSLTQVETKFFRSNDGKRERRIVTQMDGKEIVKFIETPHENYPQYHHFRDEKGNTIKKYTYNNSEVSAYVHEYEIDYYKH